MFDIEFEFGNDAAVGGAGHGGKHGGKAGVAAENFQDHETFMGARGSAQAIDHLNRARDAGAEADAVIRAGDVVVHSLGNADDFEAFFVETNTVTERVIAANWDQCVDAQPSEVLQNFGCEVILLSGKPVLEMSGDVSLGDAAGIRAGGMEKGATGTAGAVDDFLVEEKEIVGVVEILLTDHIHEAGPAVANADDLVALADGAERDAANGGVETGNVTPSSQDTDNAFFSAAVCHESKVALPWDAEQEIIASSAKFRKSRPTFFREGTAAKNLIE